METLEKDVAQTCVSAPTPTIGRWLVGLGLLTLVLGVAAVIHWLVVAMNEPSLGSLSRLAMYGIGLVVFSHCVESRWREG